MRGPVHLFPNNSFLPPRLSLLLIRQQCIEMKTYLILPIITSLVHVATAQEVECWAPDGVTMADNTTYVPCNKLGIEQEGVYSSCCQLDGDPDKRDLCTTTGLCLRRGVLSRGYCTDRNWDSPACVNVCTEDQVCHFFRVQIPRREGNLSNTQRRMAMPRTRPSR
jgi:hypothetical protein